MPKSSQQIISLDTEATGLDLNHGARPFFVSVCKEVGKPPVYWDAHVDPLTREPQWDPNDLVEIADLVAEVDGLVLQNPKFDVRALEMVGLHGDWPWHKTVDTLMAGHLLCSNQPHDLTTMTMIYLRANIQPLEDALEVATKAAQKIAKHEFSDWQLASKDRPDMPSAKEKTWKYDSWLPRAIAKAKNYPPDHDWWHVLAKYGNGDSSVTLPLYLKQEQLLKKQGLWKIYLERLKLLPVIYQMEANGITMSRSRLEELYARLTTESEKCRQQCIELADGEIEDLPVNGMSNALRYVLFEKFSLKSNKKTPKGAPSGDKQVLDHWLAALPEQSRQWQFVNSLRHYRKRKTAIGYMDSYQKFWLPFNHNSSVPTLNELDTMIVYPSYNATGTDTLRFSSQNPNAQQVSKQEETNTRYCFGPAPGREWWAIDFSNLELRIPAYESGEEDMVYLFEHPDEPPYYGSYHMLVFDTLHPSLFAKHGMESKDLKEYQWTKNGNFAVQYGAVEKSGTADRAYHVPGAQKRIMFRFGRIKQLSKKWIEFANEHGYIETIPDKTVDPIKGYPLWCTRTEYNRVLETVPLSYHVQGTAMWITMKAMIRCQDYLNKNPKADGKIIGQVHDEMLFDFPKGVGIKHIEMLKLLMIEGGFDVGVPLDATVHYHPVSWADKEKWDE